MIDHILNWFVPFHVLIDPQPIAIGFVKKPVLNPPQLKAVEESLFTIRDSFGAASKLQIEEKGNHTKIQYDVDDIDPIFAEFNKNVYQLCFPDFMIAEVPHQFMIDFVRTSDIGEASDSIPVHISEPFLSLNGEPITWHNPSDTQYGCSFDPRRAYPAPVLAKTLFNAMGNDLERFSFLTGILTQTPFNDMYKTISAQIHERYGTIMINGRSGVQNMLESPRFKGYQISVTRGETPQYRVTAAMAGYFAACAMPPGTEIVERRPEKEIGWYGCKSVYDLDERTAQVQLEFIINMENIRLNSQSDV